jgi:hypothetical protein
MTRGVPNKSNKKGAAKTTNAPVDNHRSCPACKSAVGAKVPSIDCDICGCWYHAKCTELSAEVFDVLVGIAAATGWVCVTCRSSSREAFRALQGGQAKLAEEVAALTVANEQLAARMDALEGNRLSDANSVGVGHGPVNDEFKEIVRKEVAAEARDKEKRRKNIIVSGLPISSTSSAHIEFTSLCESHLGCKPLIAPENCSVIDKPVTGKIPRLKITFASEHTRDDILARGRSLRLVDDSAVRSIYLNPDLTQAEAKTAYEERVRRRLKKSQPTSRENDDNTPPPTFPASSDSTV